MKYHLTFLLIIILTVTSAFGASNSSLNRKYHNMLSSFPKSKSFLTEKEMKAVFYNASNDATASLAVIKKYDPTGAIGFCFGRAMAVHLYARKLGLKQRSIRKFFIVGDMRSNPAYKRNPEYGMKYSEWRFHVTTLVRGKNGRWYAIDPIMEGPMSINRWIRKVKKGWRRNTEQWFYTYDKTFKENFYMTPANAIMPDLVTFKAPAQERGNHIIELSFNPHRKSGFKSLNSLGNNVYRMSGHYTNKYYITLMKGIGRFNMNGVTINGGVTELNNYFRNLLKSVETGKRVKAPLTRDVGERFNRKAPLGFRPRR